MIHRHTGDKKGCVRTIIKVIMRFISILIFLLAFVTYAASLANGFAFDDHILILDNPGIFSIERALNYFTHATFPGDLYRPLTMLSYAFNYSLDGFNPTYYHLVNILLHSVICICIYNFLLKLFERRLAFLTSVLFAVLPIHTEAVANIVGRAELLSALFVVLSVSFFIRWIDKVSIVNALLCGLFLLLGLFSKESAICAVLLFPLIAYYKDFKLSEERIHVSILILIGTILIWIIARSFALGSFIPQASQTSFIDNPLYSASFFERLLPALSILGKYLGLSILPLRLSADYSYPALLPFTFDLYESLACLFVTALAILAAFIGLRIKSITGFFLLWFFLAFAITSNVLVPIGTIMGERLAYLPSLGAAGLLAWLLLRISNKALLNTSFLVICLCFALISNSWSKVWKDNKTLHAAQIEVMPESAKTQLNYSMVMLEEKRYEEADLHARKALKLYPKYAHAAWALGEIYYRRGAYQGAEKWFRKAQSLDANHADSLLGLGRLALALGDLKAAEIYFDMTLKKKPSSFEADIGRLAVFVNKKEWDKAEDLAGRLNEWNSRHRELQKVVQIMNREMGL